MKTTNVESTYTNVKTSISKLRYGVHSIEKKIASNRYEPSIGLEDKVYPKIYYKHQPGDVAMYETLAKIKARKL